MPVDVGRKNGSGEGLVVVFEEPRRAGGIEIGVQMPGTTRSHARRRVVKALS